MAGSGWHLRDGVKSNLVEGKLQVVERDADGRPLREIIDATDELGRTLHAEGRTTNLLKLSVYGNWFDWYGLAGWEFDGVPADAAEPPRRRAEPCAREPANLRMRGSVMVAIWLAGFRIADFLPLPKPGDGAAQGADMYADDGTAIRFGLMLTVACSGLLAPFIGVVSAQMKRIEGGNSPLTYARSRWAPC